jgi:hypothetical protein
VSALLRLSGAAGQPLSQEQWDRVATILDPIGIAPVPFAGILALQRHEAAALACSLPGAPGVGYFERRMRAIEAAMVDPLLSAAERAVLSGWLLRLAASLGAEEIRALPFARAIWLLERFGAAAYRADSLWFGRGEVAAPPIIGPLSRERPRPAPEAIHSDEERAWTMFHHAREVLDLWGRFRVADEVRRVDPYVDAAFSGDLAQPTTSTVTFPPDLTPAEQDDIERATRVPRDRWTITETFISMDVQPQSHDHICELVDQGRGGLTLACRDLTRLGRLEHATALPEIDPDRLRALLLGPPARAVVITETLLPLPFPLVAFFGQGGEIVRYDVGRYEEQDRARAAFRALCDLREAIHDDRKDQTQATFAVLGGAITALEDALRPWSEALADRLASAGATEIAFLNRGIASVHVPWEDLSAGGGGRLGDRFAVGHVHTLASLPSVTPPERSGVVQIHGDGVSAAEMQPAASMMQSLAAAGLARPPLTGGEACEGPLLWRALGATQRLRFFLHGYHHPTRPTADRLTLVDLRDDMRDVHLSPDVIRALPLRGLRCAELWACEGAAHGRYLMEHGVANEPEDLTTAFLLAGAQRVLASRWHVPALPSALLMERFAILVDGGVEEARALAAARGELRAAFSPGGSVEAVMTDRLRRQSPGDGEATGVTAALAGALHDLRAGWYRSRGVPLPGPLSLEESTLARMVRFLPPRAERLTGSHDGPRDVLTSLRNPACWAGWGITLRSLDAWDA